MRWISIDGFIILINMVTVEVVRPLFLVSLSSFISEIGSSKSLKKYAQKYNNYHSCDIGECYVQSQKIQS